MTKGNDVTMDAIKYLESRLPPGIRGNTLVDGDTLAIAIGEFDAAQKRADALAEENARLRDALAAVAALGELPYVPQDGCTADGRIEAANIAKRALDGEGGRKPGGMNDGIHPAKV